MSKNNKIAIITGGSSGIGYQIAELLASDEVNLVLISNDAGELEVSSQKLQLKYKIDVKTIDIDLADYQQIIELSTNLIINGVIPDFLVNCAGFGSIGPFITTELDHELEMINLNVLGTYTLTKLLLPEMIKRNRGRILNFSSASGLQPSPNMAAYGASKAFIHDMSVAIQYELKQIKSAVSCTVICPPPTRSTGFAQRSKMTSNSLFHRLGAMEAEDVAKIAYNAMQKGKATVYPPWWYGLGMTILRRFFPLKLTMDLISFFIRE